MFVLHQNSAESELKKSSQQAKKLPRDQREVGRSGGMPQKLLTDLPADVVQHILMRLALAHHIARAAPTCKVVSVAARNAIRVRQFSSEVAPSRGTPRWWKRWR